MERQLPARFPRQRQLSNEAIERGRKTRALAIVVLGLVLSTRAVQGQDGSRSRDLVLGHDLPPISALVKVASSDATTIHQLPAAMQELELHRQYVIGRAPDPQNDPVRQIVVIFSHDQLSKMAADAEHDENTRTVTSRVEEDGHLPWGLRRTGAGVKLTVSGVDISIQRNSIKLSKSVTF
jgi:hypothetical protein